MALAGSTRRVLVATPLALIALALGAAPSAADPHALPKVKEVTTRVETSSIALPQVNCPEGTTLLTPFWRAISGLAEVHAANLTKTSATFFVRRLVGDSVTVEVGVRCVKKETGLAKDQRAAHFHELSINVVTGTVTVPGMGGQVAVEAKCRPGSSALNAAYTDFGTTRAEVSRPAPDGDGWQFLFTNVGGTDTTAIIDAICLGDKTGVAKGKKPKEKEKGKKKGKKRKKPRKHKHRVNKKKVGRKVPVPGSPNPREDVAPVEAVINCPKDHFPVGLGYNFFGHPFTFLGQFSPVRATTAARRRRRAQVAANGGVQVQINNQSSEQEADLEADCLSDRTSDRSTD